MSEGGDTFRVLINDEEQYSLWPAHKEIPRGWRQLGLVGSREACLAYVEENWTDTTPASVRRQRR